MASPALLVILDDDTGLAECDGEREVSNKAVNRHSGHLHTFAPAVCRYKQVDAVLHALAECKPIDAKLVKVRGNFNLISSPALTAINWQPRGSCLRRTCPSAFSGPSSGPPNPPDV